MMASQRGQTHTDLQRQPTINDLLKIHKNSGGAGTLPPTTPAAAQAEYPLAPLAERNRKDRKEAVPSISRTARRDRGYEDYMGNQGLRLQHVIKAFHSGRGRDGLELKQPYTGNDQSQQPHSPPSSYPSSSSSSRRVFLNKEEGIAISGSDNGDAKLDEKLEVRPPSPSPSPPPRMHDSDNLTGDGVGTNTEVGLGDEEEAGFCGCCNDVIEENMRSCWESFSSTDCGGWMARTFGNQGYEMAVEEMTQGVQLTAKEKEINTDMLNGVLDNYPKSAVFSCTFQRTDVMEPNEMLVHPMVRMYVVDIVTGEYWQKNDTNNCNSKSNHKNKSNNTSTSNKGQNSRVEFRSGGSGTGSRQGACDFMLPIMSRPCELSKFGAFVSTWNERLVTDEPMAMVYHPRALLLFEVVDFGTGVDLEKYPDGLYPVCWGFLKLVGAQGRINHGAHLRMQLFRYAQASNRPQIARPLVPDVYFEYLWQRNTGMIKYPSTIWIAVGGVEPSTQNSSPDDLLLVHAKERGYGMDYNAYGNGERDGKGGPLSSNDRDDTARGASAATAGSIAGGATNSIVDSVQLAIEHSALLRHRKEGARCKLPDRHLHEMVAGPHGCFVLSFSPDGAMIAAACGQEVSIGAGDFVVYSIKIFNSDSGKLIGQLDGHHELIYDLGWSKDNEFLISAAGDGTAKIWRTAMLKQGHMRRTAITSLHHTSYVYAACFHPKEETPLIFTGAYDGMIRIWKWPKGRPRAIHPTLVVSLANHSSHINSITFAKDGSRFFTADGNGVIKVWSDTFFTGSTYLDNMGKRARRAHSMARTQEKSSDRMLEDIENKIEMQDSDGGSSSGTFTERTRASIVQSEPDFRERFKLIRSIAHERLQGDGINCIVYHSRPERLIVYCKSGALYLFSLLRYDLRKHFTGSATNHRRLRCCISPDGNYLAAGSEDGKAYFYNITTGRLEMKLDVGLTHPMCDIAWHPSQHQVAFCSFGADLPILTYEYAVPDSTTTINLNF